MENPGEAIIVVFIPGWAGRLNYAEWSTAVIRDQVRDHDVATPAFRWFMAFVAYKL